MSLESFDTISKAMRLTLKLVVLVYLCLILGATFYPITTSFTISGSITSSLPKIEVQHPIGGQIEKVFVQPHSFVSAGDALIQLDVNHELQIADNVKAEISKLESRVSLIRMVVAGLNITNISDANEDIRLEQKSLHKEIALLRAMKSKSVATAASLEREIEIIAKQKEIFEGQFSVNKDLFERSLISKVKVDEIKNHIFDLNRESENALLELERARGEVVDLDDRISLARSKSDLNLQKYIYDAQVRIDEMEREELHLKNIIDASTITAPVSGYIHKLPFDNSQMYIPKGQTAVIISREIESPNLLLQIPMWAIDQVKIGDRGDLSISGIQERDMPFTEVRINSISLNADQDSEGKSIGYSAVAKINPDSMVKLTQYLGDNGRLVEDMDVSVLLEGRKTTLASYLFNPIVNSLRIALQD